MLTENFAGTIKADGKFYMDLECRRNYFRRLKCAIVFVGTKDEIMDIYRDHLLN